jgi:hypothetical protein
MPVPCRAAVRDDHAEAPLEKRVDTRESEDASANSGEGADDEAGRIERLLDSVAKAGEGERVSVGDAMDVAGHGSFGALILVPSLILVSPVSGIPGVPTSLGAVILLVCVQYIAGRDRLWLPGRLRRIGVPRERLQRAFDRIRPGVRLLDRVVRPRLTFLVNRWSRFVVALVCAALALTLPPLEALPFVATTTAAVIALFGFAVLTHDGVVGLIAVGMTAAVAVTAAFVVVPFIGGLFG